MPRHDHRPSHTPDRLPVVAPQQNESRGKTLSRPKNATPNPLAAPRRFLATRLQHLTAAAPIGLLAAVLCVASVLASFNTAHARTKAPDPRHGNIESQHGDWQVVCKPPPPGASKPVCAVVQSVTAEDRDNVGLTVYFQKFSDGTQVLRVFAPLGVLLPPGLGLKVDGKDLGNAPFLRCQSFACYAQVTADKNLVESLRGGKTAIFIIFQTEEAGIGIPISLNGFAQAYDSLK